jgi:hypothetical protein
MNASHRILMLLPLGALALLTACGGGIATGSSAGSLRAQAGRTAAATQPAAGQAEPAGADRSAPSSSLPAASVPEGPRVQRTGRLVLDVSSGRFDATLNDVIALVDEAGGYVSGTQAQADDGQRLRSGQATFQVPAARFDEVVGEIRRKGTPHTISIAGNDVSQQYVDLQARLRNAEAQRDALLALMQQAKSVSDTIQIQNQLGQVTGQIEELKGQIDYLDHSTAYATLSVTIREVIAGGTGDEWGLQTATSQALHNVVAVISFAILWLGTLSPVLALGFGLGLVGWRLHGRRPAARAVPSATATE